VESFGTTPRLQKLTAGVMLDVKPLSIESQFVDLSVSSDVSTFIPSSEGQFGIARQTINTEVLVKAGETLIIGGLIAKETTVTENGVPGLRRILLLGRVFRGEEKRVRYVETVAYITPYIDEPSFFQPEIIAKDVEEQFDRVTN